MDVVTNIVTVKFVAVTCYECGCIFGVEDQHHTRLLRERPRAQFWCPNGHRQHYVGKTEEQLLKERLKREENATNRARAERNHAQRRLSAQKGVTTKLKKRISNGVCPACKRTFQNLARHMACKHPDYTKEKRDGFDRIN